MIIRHKNPEIYWLKRQTARFRLMANRLEYARKHCRRYSHWMCNRHNTLWWELETDCFTPLMPGEEAH